MRTNERPTDSSDNNFLSGMKYIWDFKDGIQFSANIDRDIARDALIEPLNAIDEKRKDRKHRGYLHRLVGENAKSADTYSTRHSFILSVLLGRGSK